MMNLYQAVLSLRPGAVCEIRGNEITWLDENQTQPTDEELQAELIRLQADYDAKEYQRQRQPEYPDLADLADALYWSNQGDNTKLDEYYEKVSAVKTKYPKP